MSTLTTPVPLTPEDVERASERDAKIYELVDGELKEKRVGFLSLFVAGQILARLNAHFFPKHGAAASELMIYCFGNRRHGRKPDVVYVSFDRLPEKRIPRGDLFVSPDLVVEVLSPHNTGFEVDRKLGEYLGAGISLVWIVNPENRSIRVYRQDGTHRLFTPNDVIENESALPGFRLVVGDVFPPAEVSESPRE